MDKPENIQPPKSIQDLSHLTAHSGRMALRRIFQAGGAKERKTFALQLNAVRLADLALREYNLGREAALEFHTKRQGLGITFIMRASGHFETCILALERFVKHIKALRGASFVHPNLKRILPREISFLKSTAEKQIVGLRHTFTHLEERAVKGKLPQDATVILLATVDGLYLGDHLINWNDIVMWLQDMHKCASDLADYVGDQESGSPAGA
jgi:hypothetical protein